MSRQDVYSLLLPFIPSDYHFLEARHRHRLFLPCKGTADERLTKYRRATLLKFDENFPKSQIPVFIAVATGLGWQASTTKYENRVVFDFQQYTPKGQDFNVSVEMKDGDFDRFLCELENFYEGFDPDYETYLWIGNDGHGKNGACRY